MLKAERERSNREKYIELPLRVLEASEDNGETVNSEHLVNYLTAKDFSSRSNILIEAPGGRGKSALIRRVLELSLDLFERNPSNPLPIVCTHADGNLEARARSSLGTDGFSDTILNVLLRSGDFFLIVDGLSESSMNSKQVREHLSRFGQSVPVLIASRPHADLHITIQSSHQWLIVMPERLREDMLEPFFKAYGSSVEAFVDPVRAACRNISGEYLPILVRLAIPSLSSGAVSLGDIYRVAVGRLISQDDELIDAAARLCFEVYWKTGQRVIEYSTADSDRKAILRKLLDCGLVVPVAGMETESQENPTVVRFFHDSIQTYLAAVYLSRERDARRFILLQAAGHERFPVEGSDLTVLDASEMFQMCITVFEPRDETIRLLSEELLLLIDEYCGAFSYDWVVETPFLDDETLLKIDKRTSGAESAKRIVEAAKANNNFETIAVLFARSARLLWPKIKERVDTDYLQ